MLPQGIEVRLATNDDLPAIRCLVKSCLDEFGLDYDEGTSDDDLIDLDSAYRGGAFFAAMRGPDLMGTVGLQEEGEGFKLRKMYLAPIARGQGLGRHLLNVAIQFARQKGVRHIILETTNQMIPAQTLYESAGFERVPDAPTSPRCHRTYRLQLHQSG